MAQFAAIVTFDQEAPRLQVRPTHREYLQRLLDEGKLFASGPWQDDSGALIIYEAADEAEARALLDADPYSKTAGVIKEVQIKAWNRVYLAGSA